MNVTRLAVILAALVATTGVVPLEAQAGRPIRVDFGDFNFDFSGEAWDENSTQTGFSNAFNTDFLTVQVPFKLNFSGQPGNASFMNALAGPATFILGTSCPGNDPWVCGSFGYGQPWLAENGQSPRYQTKLGRIDLAKDANGNYNIAEAVRAVQFTWYDIYFSGLTVLSLDYQVVLLDMSEATGVEGDFDVEVNFGREKDAPLPPGTQNLIIGPTAHQLTTSDPAQRVTYFCFRNGSQFLGSNCEISTVPDDPVDPVDPTPRVSEPGSAAMAGFALLLLMGSRLAARRVTRRESDREGVSARS